MKIKKLGKRYTRKENMATRYKILKTKNSSGEKSVEPITALRGRLYNESEWGQKFPDSQLAISDRWVSGTWVCGNNYHNPSGYYGSYPPKFVEKLYSMFPDAKEILHLFSGSLTKEEVERPMTKVARMDINPKLKPDIVGDAAVSIPVAYDFDLIMADPPYSIEDAEHYGPCLVNKRKVLAACHRVLRPGGTLAWMDQSIPMYRKEDWHWYGIISIYRSTNHRIRGVMLFRKV